jgi:chemotaxis protein CheX
MKVENIIPFTQAAHDVLKEILEVTIKRGSLMLKKSPKGIGGVSVLIRIYGSVEGVIIFNLSEETARKIAGAMNYENFESFDDLAKDTINELGNIIAGRAITITNNAGQKYNITPPTLILGNELGNMDLIGETIVIPFETDYGEFNINVALKENKEI